MKFLKGVIVTESDEEKVIVTVGEAAKVFSGMIKLNDTGYDIVKCIQKEMDEDAIIAYLLENYEVDEGVAKESVHSVVEQFRSIGLIA